MDLKVCDLTFDIVGKIILGETIMARFKFKKKENYSFVVSDEDIVQLVTTLPSLALNALFLCKGNRVGSLWG